MNIVLPLQFFAEETDEYCSSITIFAEETDAYCSSITIFAEETDEYCSSITIFLRKKQMNIVLPLQYFCGRNR